MLLCPDLFRVSLGFRSWADAIYRDLNNGFAFPHREGSVTLNFTGRGLQGLDDESWGIDNVTIVLTGVPPGPPTFRSPPGDFSTLVINDDGTFVRTLKGGTRINFGAGGLQTGVVDRNGNTTTYAYDVKGRLIAITDPVGLVTALKYSAGRLESITDPVGRTTMFDHDASGNLLRITDPDESSRTFAYDSPHRLTTETSKRGFVNTHTYNFAGRNVLVTRPDGTTREVSPSETFGLMDIASDLGAQENPGPVVRSEDVFATFTDGNGNVTTYKTNAFGSANEVIDPLGRRTVFTRDTNGDSTRYVDPGLVNTVLTYDGFGNMVRIVEAEGTPIEQVSIFEYDPILHRVTRAVDPKGEADIFEYDDRGNMIRSIDPMGGQQTFTYDKRGLLLSQTDENGNRSLYAYDSNGNLKTITDAAGNVTAANQAVGSAEERTFSYSYESLNRVVKTVDGTGAVYEYRYDADGNNLEVETPTGQVLARSYDEMGRLVSILNPARGETRGFTYDAAGNLLETVDGLGAVSRFTYDEADQLVKATDPGDGELQFTYDPNGNQVAIQDAKGRTTTWAYDSLNRLVQRVSPGQHSTSYKYDSMDNLVQQVNPNGSTITFSYDELSRVTKLNDVTFTYDAGGNILEVKETDSHLSFAYDALDRVAEAKTLDTQGAAVTTLTYTHDALGHRRQMADSEGGVTSYGYDAQGQLIELLTAAGDSFSQTYDPAGRILERIYPNRAVADYQYDARGLLDSLTHAVPEATTPLAAYEYGYDSVWQNYLDQ